MSETEGRCWECAYFVTDRNIDVSGRVLLLSELATELDDQKGECHAYGQRFKVVGGKIVSSWRQTTGKDTCARWELAKDLSDEDDGYE